MRLGSSLAYSCLLLFISALFLVYKYVLQVSPSVITHQLMQVYALSGAGLGVLAATFFYSYMVMQIPAGMWLDKYRVKQFTAGAIAVCVLGAFLFYHANTFVGACIARALIGFGSAFATISYMKIASIWFSSNHFSLLSGFFGTACMGGAGVAEVLTAWSSVHYGWHNMLLFSAVIGFVLWVLFSLIASDKSPDVSATPDRLVGLSDSLRKTLRNRHNYLLIAYSGLSFIPVTVFGGMWGVPFLQQAYHLSSVAAASTASMVFFGFAVSGPIFGWWSDRIRRRKPFIVFGTVAAFGFMVIVLYVPNLSLFLLNACVFLFGFFTSVFLVSYTMGIESNSLAITATVIAVINTGDALCGGIMEPLIGKLLDQGWDGKMQGLVRVFSTHDYRIAMSVLTVSVALAIIAAIFTKETHPSLLA